MYGNISQFETLHTAYKHCRRQKRFRQEVLDFSYNLEYNLSELASKLQKKTYRHGGYRHFIVNDSKKRLIRAAPFRDRIVHQAICMMLEPVFDRSFIYDSYACRKGKGTDAALERVENWLRGMSRQRGATLRETYVLQCDIASYFASIDHRILYELICNNKVAEMDMRRLIWIIINSHSDGPHRGIPIGNLTSQLFANIYLNELDKYVKHFLRERYYVRYMDDFLILGANKAHLHNVKYQMQEFLKKRLKLKLHPKKATVSPVLCGFTFLGYQLHGGVYRRLRKSTVRRFQKRFHRQQRLLENNKMTLQEHIQSVQSWDSYAAKANSWRLRQRIYKN